MNRRTHYDAMHAMQGSHCQSHRADEERDSRNKPPEGAIKPSYVAVNLTVKAPALAYGVAT
jgi:hypothetical protein